MNHRPILSALLLATVLCSSAAAADVSDTDRATARTLFAEGHKALDDKDYATAADRFARADGLVHAPTMLLGLARAQVGLGKLVSAQETYRRILREGVQPGSPAPFFKALADAQTEVDALEPRIPFVILEVKGPAGTKVTVDDVEVPSQALGVRRPIDPGKHVVRATADGYIAVKRTVVLLEGKGETVTFGLTVAAAEKPADHRTPDPSVPKLGPARALWRAQSALTGPPATLHRPQSALAGPPITSSPAKRAVPDRIRHTLA